MSRPPQHKLLSNHLRNFTYSVDIKKFSRERGNMTPLNSNPSLFRKHRDCSQDKIRRSQPSSLGITFGKNTSQKNVGGKRRMSSGFQMVKSHHQSVSIDQHMMREKYNMAKQLFEDSQYQKLLPLARQILNHFQESTQKFNLYYWIAVALFHRGKIDQAIQEMTQCLKNYPDFQQGHLLLGQLLLKNKSYSESQISYEAAIRCNSKKSIAFMELAKMYMHTQQNDKAEKLLVSVVDTFGKEGDFLGLLTECMLNMGKLKECQQLLKTQIAHYGPRDSSLLYIRGLIQVAKGNQGQAYILFDEALKYNSSRTSVRKALLQTIKIEIHKRDFYKAYHSISRVKFLQVEQTEELQIYRIFVQGAMTMMKKKSEQALGILKKISSHQKCKTLGIQALIYKYMGYGHFKLGQYAQAVIYYSKLSLNEKDQSSQYNLLLAQGVQLCDTEYRFEQAIGKFQQAKQVYPQKVQPYIYIAMTYILRFNVRKEKDEAKQAQVLIEALKELEFGSVLNPNSSNLLYHRTILQLYFEDWQSAHNDINRCIQKAEENLPKYFYLRGVCYSCIKDFKKAINQFSICVSLDPNYSPAYLQKSKNYFLLGNTEKGFSSLKLFMEKNPDDTSIYKWIGDLLYQGTSYQDALKAYKELKNINNDFDVRMMRTKCMVRTANIQQLTTQFKNLQKNSESYQQKVQVDSCAFALLVGLAKHQSAKSIGLMVKRLNNLLESNTVGCVFQLIDCMNLLGVASFYLQKYEDAYQSFVLVLQLFQSLSEKDVFCLEPRNQTQILDLDIKDICFNIAICQLAQGNTKETLKMLKKEFPNMFTEEFKLKQIERIAQLIQKGDTETIEWEQKNDRPFNYKFKRVELKVARTKIKTKPVFSFYHDSAVHLYSSFVAQQMIAKMNARYIDSMPEGPWIKRNPHGVIFTQDLQSDNSITFEDTARTVQKQQEGQNQSPISNKDGQLSKKQQFLKNIRFDSEVQAKLNNMIHKAQGKGMKKKQP